MTAWRERLLRRTPAVAAEDSAFAEAVPQPVLVDAATRTFWSRGAPAAATLVETDGHPARVSSGAARRLIASHERGGSANARPRANPAFSESFFVELMRARRYQRAYQLLTPSCQREWGSAERFAAAQGDGAMRHLRGVRIVGTMPIDEWVDPNTGEVFEHAVAVDAEYTVDNGRQCRTVPRRVHLVGVAGRWRSVVHPPSAFER